MQLRFFALALASALVCVLHNVSYAQSGNNISRLTVYEAGIGEFLEERTVYLQTGLNTIEWRSLMPRANIRTVRVSAENAVVIRQEVSYDGPDVRSEKTPVLHLVIQNQGAPGKRVVRVDYLAPNIGWQDDYSLVLEQTAEGAAPKAATLDSWVSLSNTTGTDIAAGTVDLVAGEIALLAESRGSRSDSYAYASQTANVASATEGSGTEEALSTAQVSGLSAFYRLGLGNNINLNANAPVTRFPLLQRARLAVEQRNVFENSYSAQTLGRGSFILLPRGLEVRLVARNSTGSPLGAGQVSIYSLTGDLAQIVGQDVLGFTPPNAEFSVSQGRSATILGTRRILERRELAYRAETRERTRLVTRVEIVIFNRGKLAADAFIREGIEQFGDNQWEIIESTDRSERLGASTIQFKVSIPAGGKTTLVYAVETK